MTTTRQHDLLNRLTRMTSWQGTNVASVVTDNQGNVFVPLTPADNKALRWDEPQKWDPYSEFWPESD